METTITTVIVVPRSGTSHTEEEWSLVRPLFTNLYVSQNKSLKEVAEVLKSRHGFWATERMYKTHVRRWKLDKNNKERELLHVIRKAHDARLQRKFQSFRIRGKTRTITEVHEYFKRKGIFNDSQLFDRLPSSPTPSAISCNTEMDDSLTPGDTTSSKSNETQLTHPAHELPKLQQHSHTPESQTSSANTETIYTPTLVFPTNFLCLPSPYKHTEVLLNSTKDVFLSNFFTSAVDCVDDFALETINTFTEVLYGASNAMQSKQYVQATELYGKMTYTLEDMMTTNNALCLALVYKILDGRRLHSRDVTKVSILKFITNLSAIKFGRLHPITRLVNCFLEEVDHPIDMIELGLRYTLELLVSSLGPLHPYTRQFVYRWCNALIAQGEFDEAINQLNQLVSLYESDSRCGPHDSCWSLLQLGDCFYYIRQYSQAEEIFRRVMERSAQLEISLATSISFVALMGITNCRQSSRDYIEAEKTILLCWSMMREVYGDNGYRTLMAMKTYVAIKDVRARET